MIRFQPLYASRIWGGRRFCELFGRDIPEGPIGESWELCELPNQHSRAIDGAAQGMNLGELWRDGALGGSAQGPFPFLLKWLDTADRLSVQVHPDAETCERLGQGQPKTEAWLVANAAPQASMYVGHYPGLDAATLRQAAQGGTMHKWMYESHLRAGDMVLLEAGTLHCIGVGYLILEVQQPSDTTFRVSDWGRVDAAGQARALHLDEAAASVHFDRHGPAKIVRDRVTGPCFEMRQLAQGATMAADGLRVIAAHAMPAVLHTACGEISLGYGDVAVLEPADGAVRVADGSATLVTEPTCPATVSASL